MAQLIILDFEEVAVFGGLAHVVIGGHPDDDYAHHLVSVTVYHDDDSEDQYDGGELSAADVAAVIDACGGESAIREKAADQRACCMMTYRTMETEEETQPRDGIGLDRSSSVSVLA